MTHTRWILLFVIISLISMFLFPSTSYADSVWLKFFKKDTLLNTYMRTYAVEGDRLWVGTYGDGVVIYDGKSTKNLNIKNTCSQPGVYDGLISDLITCIAVDEKSGRVWIGTNQGLSSCNTSGKAWKSFTDKDGLPNNVIRDITIDTNGNIWVATPSGVSKFDGEKWEKFNSTNGLEDENIQAIKVHGGLVWTASVGGTVSRFDGQNWKVVLHR